MPCKLIRNENWCSEIQFWVPPFMVKSWLPFKTHLLYTCVCMADVQIAEKSKLPHLTKNPIKQRVALDPSLTYTLFSAVLRRIIAWRKEMCWNTMVIVMIMKAIPYSTHFAWSCSKCLNTFTHFILTKIQRGNHHYHLLFPGEGIKYREVE